MLYWLLVGLLSYMMYGAPIRFMFIYAYESYTWYTSVKI